MPPATASRAPSPVMTTVSARANLNASLLRRCASTSSALKTILTAAVHRASTKNANRVPLSAKMTQLAPKIGCVSGAQWIAEAPTAVVAATAAIALTAATASLLNATAAQRGNVIQLSGILP